MPVKPMPLPLPVGETRQRLLIEMWARVERRPPIEIQLAHS